MVASAPSLSFIHTRYPFQSEIQKKKFTKDRALDSFDDFYGSVFGKRWGSIRAALLTRHKYMAMVNNFGDTEKTIEELEAAGKESRSGCYSCLTCSSLIFDPRTGAINLRDIYNVAKQNLQASDIRIDTSATGQPNRLIDSKLSGILQRQNQDPLLEQYDQTTTQLSGQSSAPTADDDDVDDHPKTVASQPRVDYKKPLERVIEEDSDLDYRRMVDTTLGTAGLHEFIPATRLKGMEDWVLESDHYKYYSTTEDFPLRIELETQLDFPAHLQVYTFEKGNISNFHKARRSCTNVSSHYILNGSSVLPALALNVQPGDRVLDACASPGGKSLLMLQTLHPERLVCNDVQESRLNRVEKTLSEFVFDFESKWKATGRCQFTQQDARVIDAYGEYDRVLVDVPCTTDRKAVMGSENNIFKSTRVKERLQLPELQAAILTNCLRLVRPGGSLVYATCSLSPVQNDGVVHMALSTAFREHGLTATVK